MVAAPIRETNSQSGEIDLIAELEPDPCRLGSNRGAVRESEKKLLLLFPAKGLNAWKPRQHRTHTVMKLLSPLLLLLEESADHPCDLPPRRRTECCLGLRTWSSDFWLWLVRCLFGKSTSGLHHNVICSNCSTKTLSVLADPQRQADNMFAVIITAQISVRSVNAPACTLPSLRSPSRTQTSRSSTCVVSS